MIALVFISVNGETTRRLEKAGAQTHRWVYVFDFQRGSITYDAMPIKGGGKRPHAGSCRMTNDHGSG